MTQQRSRSAAVEVLVDVIGWSGVPRWQPDWPYTERLLGLALPGDFKDLLDAVPVGEYAGSVQVGPPTGEGEEGDLLAMFEGITDMLNDGSKHPYAAYPALPGLIAWAEFDYPMAGQLFWLADDGDPNMWPVIAWGADDSWEVYDVGAVPLLIALVRGKLPSAMVEPKPGAPAYRTLQDLPGSPSNTGR
ncbi:hypothetical protein JNUCC0626_01855 [Lentzea sp. JNUCC 0626]|uniref:hypothetical protein n=1 Tax=Lentzea sp. JNUCC 0626 TaxID=3367513 RepID=UPI003748F647